MLSSHQNPFKLQTGTSKTSHNHNQEEGRKEGKRFFQTISNNAKKIVSSVSTPENQMKEMQVKAIDYHVETQFYHSSPIYFSFDHCLCICTLYSFKGFLFACCLWLLSYFIFTQLTVLFTVFQLIAVFIFMKPLEACFVTLGLT